MNASKARLFRFAPEYECIHRTNVHEDRRECHALPCPLDSKCDQEPPTKTSQSRCGHDSLSDMGQVCGSTQIPQHPKDRRSRSTRRPTMDRYGRMCGTSCCSDKRGSWTTMIGWTKSRHWWRSGSAPGNIAGGQWTPAVAAGAITGAQAIQMVSSERKVQPQLAQRGLTAATQQGHRRRLRAMSTMPAEVATMPLPIALLAWLNATRKAKRWKYSTTLHAMAATQGALTLASFYTTANSGIALGGDAVWRLGMRAVTKMAATEVPYQALAITPVALVEAIRAPTRVGPEEWVHLRALLVTAFMTSQRPLCLMRLRPGDMVWEPPSLGVTIRRGKTVATRGPYTVWTEIPAELVPVVQTWWDLPRLHEAKAAMFRTTGAEVKHQLRSVDPAYEQRSLRRGALQNMAASGVPAADLLSFSGHANIKSLMRYLGYGRLDQAGRTRMVTQARMAFAEPPPV